MEFVNGLGLLALGSRLRALSERLYTLADEVYEKHGIAIQGRWFPALRLLHDRGPSTVGEIADAIGARQSLASQHLTHLRLHGLVHVERRGHYAYYSLAHTVAREIVATLHRHYCAERAARSG